MKLESVLTYIPTDRRHGLARGTRLPDRVFGTALFADISGFTPLTEALTITYGARRGAEELTRQLNHVYDALIEEVDRFSGSIINFSGDAITCWFNGDPLAPEDSAQRALTCAFALQTAMENFREVLLPNGELVTLSLKVSVASGSARRFLVGNPSVQLIDVLAGETLDRMAEGEHLANKGEIIADVATLALIKTPCAVAEWRAGEGSSQYAVVSGMDSPADPHPFEPLPPEAIPLSLARPWVLPALLDREDETLTELRPTVALFLRFGGINWDDDDAGDRLDAYIFWVQTVLAPLDGTLVQVSIGDKGSYMYMVFGAPITHEDNAVRAANAALTLNQAPDYLEITPPQIGLSQGIMRTGAYGGRTRRTYGVLGDEVNFSARLMTHAQPGEILVSQRVHKVLGDPYTFEELPPIRVKGKSQPLPIARLTGRTSSIPQRATTFAHPLVGRQDELNALLNALSAAEAGKPGGCVIVHGEAGVGKSHLVYEARSRLTANGTVKWMGFATEATRQTSLDPFLQMLGQYFQQRLADNDAQRKTLFESTLESLLGRMNECSINAALIAELGEARSFLGALFDLRWDGSAYESFDPQMRFDRSLSAITTLFRAESACQPLILHVQDAQWLDSDSLTLILMLIESTAKSPITILMDSRERLELALSPSTMPIQSIELGELPRVGVDALVEMVLKAPVTAELCGYIYSKAAGNPFFTEQLTLDLLEREMITRTPEGHWTLNIQNGIDDLSISLNAVLVARLDRLQTQVRTIVQIASVLGQAFEIPVLAQMVKNDADFREKVQAAENEAIWVASSEWEYLFRHALLRDAAYTMQVEERLRELHALAGHAIEHVHTADLNDYAAALAFHFERAGIFDQAVTYLIKVGKQMAGRYANREAHTYFQRASVLASESAISSYEMVPIYEGLGDLYELGGSYQQAVTAYDTALERLNNRDATWRTRLFRKKGQALLQWGQLAEATACFEQGLAELQSDLNADEACQLYIGLSMIAYREDKTDAALELGMVALRMADLSREKRNAAQARQTLGILYWKKEDYFKAIEVDHQSLAVWREMGNLYGQAAVHNNLGLLYQSMDDLAAAAHHFEQCVAAFEQVGNQHGLACAYDNLGRVQAELGDQD